VIVGSAIVEIVEKNLGRPDIMERDLKIYVSRMKKAF
jgi:tryptophan synthase alpha subunit